MKFTQYPADTFKNLVMNAGLICQTFDPATGEVTGILGATTGGIKFVDKPTFKDFGADIDNCPKNTKELKKIESREVTMAGTFVTVTPATAKILSGAADVSGNKVTPRDTIQDADFSDLYFIGDYSDINTGDHAGYMAIHLMNALNTDGFGFQSTDKEKGKFAFNFMGHYSMVNPVPPYEVYVQTGTTTVTVTYNSNGGTGTMTDSNSPYALGSTVTTKANTFAKSGSTFGKWNTKADGTGTDYAAGATFTITADTILYAKWTVA